MGDESCNIDLIGLFLLSLHLPTLTHFASIVANPTPRITRINIQDQGSGSRLRINVQDPGSVDVYDGWDGINYRCWCPHHTKDCPKVEVYDRNLNYISKLMTRMK